MRKEVEGKLTNEQKRELVEIYLSENISQVELGKRYNISGAGVGGILKRRGIKANHKVRHKYTLDYSFFDIIDTEEKAYFLGFLYADGYNNQEKGSIALALQSEDKEILEKFNTLLKSNRPLFLIKSKKESHKDKFVLNITNRNMSNRLGELGCVQRKSLILKFPTSDQVPEHLLRHFIRGYFDGDGCCSICKTKRKFQLTVSILSTLEFCQKITSVVINNMNISTRISKRFKDSVNCYNFDINGTQQCMKFIEWLYHDSSIYLKRKFSKYLAIKEKLTEENRYIKYYDNIPVFLHSAEEILR